jgi:hypothetical protein
MAEADQKQTRYPKQNDDDPRQNDFANEKNHPQKYQQRDRGALDEFDVFPMMCGETTRSVKIGPLKDGRPHNHNDQPGDDVMSGNKGFEGIEETEMKSRGVGQPPSEADET